MVDWFANAPAEISWWGEGDTDTDDDEEEEEDDDTEDTTE
jgi:hypothetical protein